MISPKSLINVTGIVFLVYGLLFAVFPSHLLSFVVESAVTSTSAIIDIRATYGGMSVAVGVILLMLAKNNSHHKVGLQAVLILMACMVICRSVGLYFDGNGNTIMYVYLVLEIVVAILALSLLRIKH